MQAIDAMEIRLALCSAQHAGFPNVARPNEPVEVDELVLRLDDDAAPTLEIEPARDIVANGMAGADVDIETVALPGEGSREMIVLEILRVGQIHGERAVSRGYSGYFIHCG